MVKIITSIAQLKEILSNHRKNGAEIGLVPTMGALHEGHASLVRRSVAENDITVVSDFVNPTQFNDKNDLQNYPRTMEADCALLSKEGLHTESCIGIFGSCYFQGSRNIPFRTGRQ